MLVFLNLAIAVRAVMAVGVDRTYAPPAIVCVEKNVQKLSMKTIKNGENSSWVASTFLHAEHFQIPVLCLFTVFLPQKPQGYLACCVTSILLITYTYTLIKNIDAVGGRTEVDN